MQCAVFADKGIEEHDPEIPGIRRKPAYHPGSEPGHTWRQMLKPEQRCPGRAFSPGLS